MVEGALILLAGMALGAVLERLRKRPRRPSGPTCACGHELAFHDPASGRCHAEWWIHKNVRDHLVKCPCRRYVGPEPLPEFFAPEIAPE